MQFINYLCNNKVVLSLVDVKNQGKYIIGGIKMSTFFGLLGVLLFFIGIIYLIISFFRKKDKIKNALIIIISGVAIFFIALAFSPSSDSSDATTESSETSNSVTNKLTVYKTKITSVKENDNHDWVIKGTIKAPNGTKIGVINPDSSDPSQLGSESTEAASWAKSHGEQFTVIADPIDLVDGDEKAGQKIKVIVFGLSNYNKKWEDSFLTKKALNKVENLAKYQTLTVSNGQESYYKSLDSSSDSSSKEDAETPEQHRADNLPKNVLYGYRDSSNSEKNKIGGYKISDRDYVRFWTNDDDIIISMKLDFRNVPLMVDDPDNKDYITDNTAEDATQTQDLGDDKYIYHSNKYNLDYQVDFQKNSAGDITLIMIYPKQ